MEDGLNETDVPDRSRRAATSRRRFLQLAASGASLMVLAACGGSTAAPKPAAQPAAQPAAPAAKPSVPNLSGTTLSVLQWTSFIKESDPFFQKQVQDDFMKSTGATVNVEFVNPNDLQPKIAAAIQSGSGPDIVQFQYNWPHLYREKVIDVSDVAADIKKSAGEFFPQLESATRVDGKYLAVPHDLVGIAYHWRKSWFKDAGAEKFPATWADLFTVGKKLKATGRPIGQALGHSFGDPPTFCYPLLWAYGGREVDEQGKVAINSPETIAAVRALKDAWKDAFVEDGTGWDDNANNLAFAAEAISATTNGASIWWAAQRDKKPFMDDIGLSMLPAGPKGQNVFLVNNAYAIMGYSKNAEAAKAFIRWSMSDDVWLPWFEVGGSYYMGVGTKQNETPLWDKFPPVARTFKEAGALTRAPGWPGPWDQKAGRAQSDFVVVDMFSKAVQGESPEAAVAWAEKELQRVYG
jgi:multiple sugar transport system substrate-binding protein